MANILKGVAGCSQVVDAPLTTAAAAEAVPELLRSEIDSRIARIRPMATPVDQISRLAGSRKASSMEVAYYSVDLRQERSSMSEDFNLSRVEADTYGMITAKIKVKEPEVFAKSDTIMFPGHADSSSRQLTGYISEIEGDTLTAVLSGKSSSTLTAGSPVIRMGRAAAELDVQTSQYQALPQRSTNYCQIFKMQVEQSVLMRLADKEVGWNFSEQEEAAVVDMRLGMEKNFLFGSKARVFDRSKNEHVYLTGGIWNQAGSETSVNLKSLGVSAMIELSKTIFTGNNGSRKRILIGGSEFVAAVSKIHTNDNKILMGTTHTKWGIETREITTNFGSLYILHSEVFDLCGHASDAMVLDQAYITKYAHIPFKAERLDMRSSGTRNTDAVVLTEASCLVLRNPKVHFRILGS